MAVHDQPGARAARPAGRSPRSRADGTMAPRARTSTSKRVAPARRNPPGRSNRGAIAAARRASARGDRGSRGTRARVLKFGGSSAAPDAWLEHAARGRRSAARQPRSPCRRCRPRGNPPPGCRRHASVSASLLPRIQCTSQPARTAEPASAAAARAIRSRPAGSAYPARARRTHAGSARNCHAGRQR